MTTSSGTGPSPHAPSQQQHQQQHQQQFARAQQQPANLALQNAPKYNALGLGGMAGASSASAAIAATGNGRGGRSKQLQQRAAAAAQALNTERKMSTREIQAMLEKNETALRGWNALHKQQPPKALTKEHKEWTRRCLTYRQQIGARLEVLASLADKQIAQEDATNGGKQRASPMSAAANNHKRVASSGTTAGASQSTASATGVPPPPMANHTTQASTVGNNAASVGVSEPMGDMSTSSSMTMPTITAETPPTVFPEPPMPMAGMSSTSTAMFFPTGQSGAMQIASGPVAVSGANVSTQGFAMGSGSQTFVPNTYMASTSMPASSSTDFMAQQNYNAMGSMGMMAPQQFLMMPMQMPMNLAASATNNGPMFNVNGNMYGNNNSGNMQLPADPFNSGFGVPAFQTQPGFNNASVGFPMSNGMVGMQTSQMMAGPMNAGGFGTLPDPSMMMNNFQFGAPGNGMNTAPPPSSQGMMPTQQPAGSTQAYQATPTSGPQTFQQQGQQQPQQDTSNAMNSFADPALFDDTTSSANLFDGFPDDAFLPMQ